MIAKFYVKHPAHRNNQVTYLAADYAAGGTALAVKNTAGFALLRFAVLGKIGYENAELVRPTTITAPSSFAVLAAATKFVHNADTLVTYFEYDQIKIYRSTTGIAGTYSILSTVDISIDNDVTFVTDASSDTGYYYKFAYYNSAATIEADLSDPIAPTGYVFWALRTMTDRVLSLFGDTKEEFVSADEVRDYIQGFYDNAQMQVAIATKRHNILPYVFTVTKDVVDYALPSDWLMEKEIKMSRDGGTRYDSPVIMQSFGSIGTVVQNGVVYTYTIYNNYIRLDPTPSNSTDKIRAIYTPTPAVIVNPTDLLISPFTMRSDMFVKAGLAGCYLKDKKIDDYKTLRDEADLSLKQFIMLLRKLSNAHPEAGGVTNPSMY